MYKLIKPTRPHVDMVAVLGNDLQCPVCFYGKIASISWEADTDSYCVICKCGSMLELPRVGKTKVLVEGVYNDNES